MQFFQGLLPFGDDITDLHNSTENNFVINSPEYDKSRLVVFVEQP